MRTLSRHKENLDAPARGPGQVFAGAWKETFEGREHEGDRIANQNHGVQPLHGCERGLARPAPPGHERAGTMHGAAGRLANSLPHPGLPPDVRILRRRGTTARGSIAAKRNQAGRNDGYLLRVLPYWHAIVLVPVRFGRHPAASATGQRPAWTTGGNRPKGR